MFKELLTKLGVFSIYLIVLESFCHTNSPESLLRPTIFIDYCAAYSRSIWSWCGFQFARFTNLYYFIKEFVPFEDIQHLIDSIYYLMISPFEILRGYYNYYMVGVTPLQYGLISSLIATGIISLIIKLYWKKQYSCYLYHKYHSFRKCVTRGNNKNY